MELVMCLSIQSLISMFDESTRVYVDVLLL